MYMKKIFIALLLVPMLNAEDIKESIKNLSCEFRTLTLCPDGDDCETFNKQTAERNGINTSSSSIIIKKTDINDESFYFIDIGFGFQLSNKQANRIVKKVDGETLNSKDWEDKNLTYEVDLITKDFIYEVKLKKPPYARVLTQISDCEEGQSIFD